MTQIQLSSNCLIRNKQITEVVSTSKVQGRCITLQAPLCIATDMLGFLFAKQDCVLWSTCMFLSVHWDTKVPVVCFWKITLFYIFKKHWLYWFNIFKEIVRSVETSMFIMFFFVLNPVKTGGGNRNLFKSIFFIF